MQHCHRIRALTTRACTEAQRKSGEVIGNGRDTTRKILNYSERVRPRNFSTIILINSRNGEEVQGMKLHAQHV